MTPILLVTRPLPEAERFVRTVMARLARPPQVILSPLFDIVALGVETPPEVAGLVLTSARGAEAAGRIGLPRGLPAWCVGAQDSGRGRGGGPCRPARRGGCGGAGESRSLPPVRGDRSAPQGGRMPGGDVAARLTAGGVSRPWSGWSTTNGRGR